MSGDVVFLVDVDNTLLDNDRIIADLRTHLKTTFGVPSSDHYWSIFESLRGELGYADYLGALQRYRAEIDRVGPGDQRLLLMSSFLVDYPFPDRLYPRALDVLARLGTLGRTVILSDGDVVFQPRKIQRSGLWDAVDGRVLIYIHKELMLDARCSAPLPGVRRYVMVDDKQRILTAMKKVTWRDRLVDRLPAPGPLRPRPRPTSRVTRPPADLVRRPHRRSARSPTPRRGSLALIQGEPIDDHHQSQHSGRCTTSGRASGSTTSPGRRSATAR